MTYTGTKIFETAEEWKQSVYTMVQLLDGNIREDPKHSVIEIQYNVQQRTPMGVFNSTQHYTCWHHKDKKIGMAIEGPLEKSSVEKDITNGFN